MTKNTNIEWADSTFNGWEGCNKVSPGCAHCYAEARNARFGGGVAVNWGPGAPRRRTSAANWQQPLKWEREACLFRQCNDCGWRGTMKGMLCMQCHSADTKEARQRVFCSSLADVFDNEVPETWRWDLFRLIAATPNLDWLLLTKRIGNASKMLNSAAAATLGDFVGANAWDLMAWPNVWIGATIVNQEEADRDIPKLLDTPAVKRFLSIEPMLGPVDLSNLNEGREINELNCLKPDLWGEEIEQWRDTEEGWEESFEDWYGVSPVGLSGPMHNAIDWIICGGESGPNARPMHPDWARSLRDQCEAAGVPFLFKQWGEHYPAELEKTIDDGTPWRINQGGAVGRSWYLDDSIKPPTEWLPVRFAKVGKKAAGRMLDGRTWEGFP